MTFAWLSLLITAYIIAGRLTVQWLRGVPRDLVFALLNLAGLYGFFCFGKPLRFCIYVGLVVCLYLTLVLFGKKGGARPWIAFAAPILLLVVVRYIFPAAGEWLATFFGNLAGIRIPIGLQLIGISYIAFRSSYLVLEVRNDAVPMPSIWQYLGFCFFAPTVSVGPINSYSNHIRAFRQGPERCVIPVGRCLLRILVGLVKFFFLGNFFNQLSYDGLLMDDHFHHLVDLPVSCVFYYLFLYCNFSGYCDAAIGAAGLMGIPVTENFCNPFAARNVKDFWNRWHITLSTYMREVVFSPLSKALSRLFGPSNVNHAIAVTIAVVFLLIGIWHGFGWNYLAFGAVHAAGVVTNHYYTIWLKKVLGRDRFKAYNTNPWIQAGAITLTFCYIAASLMLFANSFADLKILLSTFTRSS